MPQSQELRAQQAIVGTASAVGVINSTAAEAGIEDVIPYFAAVRGVISVGIAIWSFFSGRSKKKKQKKKARQEAAKRAAELRKQRLLANQTSFTSTTIDLPLGEEVDQRIIVGEVITNGVAVFSAVSGPYLVRTFVLACHEVEDFVSMSLNRNLLKVGRDGYATNEPYLVRDPINNKIEFEQRTVNYEDDDGNMQTRTVDGRLIERKEGEFRKYLRIATHNGALPAFSTSPFPNLNDIHPILAQRFNVPGNFRLTGHATITLEQYRGAYLEADERQLGTENATNLRTKLIEEANRVYNNGNPGSPRFRIRGLKVWDPRDPFQNKDDDRTWKYSNNAGLVIPTVMQMRQFTGGEISFDNFHIDSIVKAANICEQFIKKSNGRDISRYTINGVIQTSEPPYQVIQKMLNSCGGILPERQGKYYLDIFSPREPCDTITDNDILNNGWSFSQFLKTNQEFSKVRPEFSNLSPSGLGEPTEAPIISVSIPDSRNNNSYNPDYGYTSDPDRAQHLAAIEANLQKIPKTFTFPMNLRGMKYETGDVVNVNINSEKYKVVNETYHIDEVEIDKDENLARISVSQFSNDTFIEAEDIQIREYRPQPVIVNEPRIGVANVVVNELLNQF